MIHIVSVITFTRRNGMRVLFPTLFLLAVYSTGFAHCEIPCGIYDDQLRIDLIKEHIGTIEKSIMMIDELTKADDKDYNQIVRWVVNKEDHANKIQEIVYQYFMNQRIKPVDGSDEAALDKYHHELTLLHHMLVYSMKSKQSLSIENTEKLRSLVDDFVLAYFGEEKMMEKHHH